ncbi:MAG: M15 family metallopeptidase [Bacteroidales bacterium]|nr:M15 family metallopeptidase [Tenuifilaceae bacterium]
MKNLIAANSYVPIIFGACFAISCIGAAESNLPESHDNAVQAVKEYLPKPQPIDTVYYTKLLLGKIQYGSDTNFVAVKPEHSSKSIFLEVNTYQAFQQMYKAAKIDGVNLTIISGSRNFDYQKRIWERKWNSRANPSGIEKAKDILTYSSMPGTSRHHWGTDFDLNSLENSYFDSGKGLVEYNWLSQNAPKFGFCQVYTCKQQKGRTGYEMEKWHWSYMPLASQYLKLYKELISYNDINGFAGSEFAPKLNVINDYVFGIATCQEEK